jgi:hypothetical protein
MEHENDVGVWRTYTSDHGLTFFRERCRHEDPHSAEPLSRRLPKLVNDPLRFQRGIRC